jgi:hypothetical protein
MNFNSYLLFGCLNLKDVTTGTTGNVQDGTFFCVHGTPTRTTGNCGCECDKQLGFTGPNCNEPLQCKRSTSTENMTAAGQNNLYYCANLEADTAAGNAKGVDKITGKFEIYGVKTNGLLDAR